jgi:hypothetical protein
MVTESGSTFLGFLCSAEEITDDVGGLFHSTEKQGIHRITAYLPGSEEAFFFTVFKESRQVAVPFFSESPDMELSL